MLINTMEGVPFRCVILEREHDHDRPGRNAQEQDSLFSRVLTVAQIATFFDRPIWS